MTRRGNLRVRPMTGYFGTRTIPALFTAIAIAMAVGSPAPATAQGVSQFPLEGLWIGRFFSSDEDKSKVAQSSFCGAHRSPFHDLYFEFGRVNAVLVDQYGFQLELAGAFIGRNFIGEVRLTDGKGLELLGPAKGVINGLGAARISFNAKDLGGKSDRVCNAVLHLKKGTGGD